MPKGPKRRRERGLGKQKYNHHTAVPPGGLTETSPSRHTVAVLKVLQREMDCLLKTSRNGSPWRPWQAIRAFLLRVFLVVRVRSEVSSIQQERGIRSICPYNLEKAHLEFRFYSTSSRVQHKVSKPGGINEIPVEVFEAVASKGCGLGRLSGKVLFKLPIPIPCGKYEFSKPCP